MESTNIQIVAVCVYHQFCVCVAGALVKVRSGYGILTIKHIQPHTALTINERKSVEPNPVTAQCTAYESPRGWLNEWTETCRGLQFFSVLNVNVC
jgi:hypothetical protein